MTDGDSQGSRTVPDRGRKLRLVLVEDDHILATMIAEYLEREGYEVKLVEDGNDGVTTILSEWPDAVVLDLKLPGMDGFSVCRAVRPRYTGPILIMTACDDDYEQVAGLELGADDYLVKPVRPRLLLARLRALMRRVRPNVVEAAPGRVRAGRLYIDTGARRVEVDGCEVEMTGAEFELLWLLARHAGQIVTRDMMYTQLSGIAYDGVDRSMDIRVSRLRRKLQDDPEHPTIIKSIRGVGYLLVQGP